MFYLLDTVESLLCGISRRSLLELRPEQLRRRLVHKVEVLVHEADAATKSRARQDALRYAWALSTLAERLDEAARDREEAFIEQCLKAAGLIEVDDLPILAV